MRFSFVIAIHVLIALLFASCKRQYPPYTCVKDCYELAIDLSFQDSVDNISYLDGMCYDLIIYRSGVGFKLPSVKIKDGKLKTSFIIDTMELKNKKLSIELNLSQMQPKAAICTKYIRIQDIPNQYQYSETIFTRKLKNVKLIFNRKSVDSIRSVEVSYEVGCTITQGWSLPIEPNRSVTKNILAVNNEPMILTISKRLATSSGSITTRDTIIANKNEFTINY